MQTPVLADAGFAIPPRPAAARVFQGRSVTARAALATRDRIAALGAVQEASLLGLLGLLIGWGGAELALWLQGM